AGSTVVVQEWDWSRFAVLEVFQAAPRNGGHVELLQDAQSKEFLVAKVMPLCWTCADHETFVKTYPGETEMPWRDVCITQYLDQRLGEPHVCKFLGIFRRLSKGQDAGGRPCDALQEGEHCLVLSYCRGGDLFTWLERSRSIDVVASREQLARPLIHQTLK
ncbi:kin-29, partial [Symbiodinium necroappetens]